MNPFKKIEIWNLYLSILLGLIFAIGFGILVRQELVGSTKMGFLSRSALFLAEIPSVIKRSTKNLVELEDQRFPDLAGFSGDYNEEEMYLLLPIFNGDIGESTVSLIDLRNFENLHTWNPDIEMMNALADKNSEEFKYLDRDKHESLSLLQHPLLGSDGGLYFQDTSPLRKIDSCSNLIWQNDVNLFHHSNEVDIDGNLWVPSHLHPQVIEERKVGRKLVQEEGFNDDAIVKLSPDGNILYEKSVSEIFIENGMEYLLFSVGDRNFQRDPIHLNDIQPVNFDGDYWKKGDVFLSLRHQSMVILFRPKTNQIIWKGVGKQFLQHDVDIIDEHRISIYNNNAKHFMHIGETIDGHNEVLIYDFKTNSYESYLKESLKREDVRTRSGGMSEILPNGDLYIEETDFGRTLYFNNDGSLKWSYVNRSNNGSIYAIAWSRILYEEKDKQNVRSFLANKVSCKK